MERKLTCIVCPIGCEITVKAEGKTLVSVEGNSCRRGYEYAVSECTAPVRTLTTTAATEDGKIVSVKTDRPVPKELLFPCMRQIRTLRVPSGVKAGDIVLQNIQNTGADVVVTRGGEE